MELPWFDPLEFPCEPPEDLLELLCESLEDLLELPCESLEDLPEDALSRVSCDLFTPFAYVRSLEQANKISVSAATMGTTTLRKAALSLNILNSPFHS